MDKFFKIKTGMTNNYVIKLSEGYLLIDTGMGSYDSFKKKLNNHNINIGDIRYIMLTHHHSDHLGLHSEIRKDNGNVKYIVHKDEVPFLKGGENKKGNYKKSIVFNIIKSLAGSIKQEFTPVDLNDEDIIIDSEDSDMLRDKGINGTLIHTPGHTPGSLSLVLDTGEAFVGDLVMNFFFSSPEPFLFDDMNIVHRSWKKLIDKEAKKIYAGHGKPIYISKLKEVLK